MNSPTKPAREACESCSAKVYRLDVRGDNEAHKSELHFSKTKGFASEISTALILGLSPKLKSVEFSDANPLVFEMMNILKG